MATDSNPFKDGIPDEPNAPRKNSFILWFIAILPLGLILGSAWGLYLYFSQPETIAQKASKAISRSEITQILTGWGSELGDRSTITPEGRSNLSLGGKILAGELQTLNSGLINKKDANSFVEAGRPWEIHWLNIPGEARDRVLFVVTSYDGEANLRNAAKVAIPITVAKSLAAEDLDFSLRFVFLPKQQDLESQQTLIESACLESGETNLGIFFLGQTSPSQDSFDADLWKASTGDLLWANEIMKGSRVMNSGMADLYHGVLKPNTPLTTADSARVEKAAQGLRNILIFATGGDR